LTLVTLRVPVETSFLEDRFELQGNPVRPPVVRTVSISDFLLIEFYSSVSKSELCHRLTLFFPLWHSSVSCCAGTKLRTVQCARSRVHVGICFKGRTRAPAKVGTNGRGSTRRPSLTPAGSLRPAGAASGQSGSTPSHKTERVSCETKTHTGPVGPAESSRPLTGDDTRCGIATSPLIDTEIPTTRPCPPRFVQG
jgi:hypothetical protein